MSEPWLGALSYPVAEVLGGCPEAQLLPRNRRPLIGRGRAGQPRRPKGVGLGNRRDERICLSYTCTWCVSGLQLPRVE